MLHESHSLQQLLNQIWLYLLDLQVGTYLLAGRDLLIRDSHQEYNTP